jgi:hypothetical protein
LLKIEAILSSETLVGSYQAAWNNIPKDSILRTSVPTLIIEYYYVILSTKYFLKVAI